MNNVFIPTSFIESFRSNLIRMYMYICTLRRITRGLHNQLLVKSHLFRIAVAILPLAVKSTTL